MVGIGRHGEASICISVNLYIIALTIPVVYGESKRVEICIGKPMKREYIHRVG